MQLYPDPVQIRDGRLISRDPGKFLTKDDVLKELKVEINVWEDC